MSADVNPCPAARAEAALPPEEADPWLPERGAVPDHPEERPGFEALFLDLSAAFVGLPADAVDAYIEHAQRRLVEFLGVERSSFAEYVAARKHLLVTHSYVVAGFPPFPRVIADEEVPWLAAKVCQGEVIRLRRLPDDLPPEAVNEREHVLRVGVKSNLTIPLKVGGSILGALTFGSFRVYQSWPDGLVRRLQLVGELFANALARKLADEVLRESEERYRRLVETTHAVPWEADARTWRFTYVGPQAVPLLGYSVEAWYGDDFWARHLHPEDREDALRYCQSASQLGRPYELEYRLLSASGTEVWVHDLVTVEADGGVPRMLRGVFIDITARKRAEAESQRLRDELAHVGRVATMGELAASIAHEINQPLSAIVSNAQTADCLLAEPDCDLGEVRDALVDIRKDGRRASDVIARIRALLRKDVVAHAPLDLNEAAQEVLPLVRDAMGKRGIDLRVVLGAGIPWVRGDRVQLQQVILNLLVNAIEAPAAVDAGRRRLEVKTAPGPNGCASLAVTDSGPGLAATDLGKVFNAFYTTKPDGMGMGLAISRSIVQDHSGQLTGSNHPDGGATFAFTLPAARGTAGLS